MDKEVINICCKFGFSVNLLIENIEFIIEELAFGEEITEKQIRYLKEKIARVKYNDKHFREMLGIENRKTD